MNSKNKEKSRFNQVIKQAKRMNCTRKIRLVKKDEATKDDVEKYR